MTDTILLGVANSVVEQLSSPALKEFLFPWNFKKDLKGLSASIEALASVLYDAEKRQSKEQVIKFFQSKLTAVLYVAEDLLDAIAARALRRKAMKGSAFKKEVILFFSRSNHLSFVFRTARAIRDIRKCLDDIADDITQFENQSAQGLIREETHSFLDAREVFGRDQEREDIICSLLWEDDSTRNLEVFSVIGFGGLGKTTLAQLVYNDERVQKGFDICLWTCINYLSDLQSVLLKILTSYHKAESHDTSVDQLQSDISLDLLQREIREKIGEKKYLLVLDNLCDENIYNWGKLEPLLNLGKIGSKVLITTRKTRVAQCLGAIEPFYNLNILSEESAWSLFVKMAYNDGEYVGNSELDSLGKQIVHKCGYVPLLVTSVGRELSLRKKERKEGVVFFFGKGFSRNRCKI